MSDKDDQPGPISFKMKGGNPALQKTIERAVRSHLSVIAANREHYVEAWLAQTGFDPIECVIMEKLEADGSTRLWVEPQDQETLAKTRAAMEARRLPSVEVNVGPMPSAALGIAELAIKRHHALVAYEDAKYAYEEILMNREETTLALPLYSSAHSVYIEADVALRRKIDEMLSDARKAARG